MARMLAQTTGPLFPLKGVVVRKTGENDLLNVQAC